MNEGENTPNIVKEEIPYTDFPLDEENFVFMDNILMFSLEYCLDYYEFNHG
jgi:hypothetical protein